MNYDKNQKKKKESKIKHSIEMMTIENESVNVSPIANTKMKKQMKTF